MGLFKRALPLALALTINGAVFAGLVGHWKFDGDLNDSVGGNHGEPVGDASAGMSNGKIGGSVSFDGDDDAVTIPPDVIPGVVFSMSFWEFSAGEDNIGYFVGSGPGDGWEDFFFRRFGDGGFQYAGGITQIHGTAAGFTFGETLRDGKTGIGEYDRDEWHHHVVTHDEDGVGQWYVDGASELDQEVSEFEGLTEDLYVGNRFSMNRDFDGLIDDLQIYDSVLSEEDARFLFDNPGAAIGGATVLQAGDADQDFDFDQLDLVKVQIAAKYLTGAAATWGQGDWNGAPGGEPGNPPAGDGVFDQLDIITALSAGNYLTGPYAAIKNDGIEADGQTSISYNPASGEVGVDAPTGLQLTSINIDSARGIFTGDAAQSLGGSFDNDSDGNIFKATFGGSFGTTSFGNVAQPGLARDFLLNDLSVVGSLAGGGDLGDVDLIYVPEPSTVGVLFIGLLGFAAPRTGRHSRSCHRHAGGLGVKQLAHYQTRVNANDHEETWPNRSESDPTGLRQHGNSRAKDVGRARGKRRGG